MKLKTANDRNRLAQRLRAMRRAGALTLASLSTLRAVATIESREADRLTRQIVAAGRTDDTITDPEIATVSRFDSDTIPAPHSLAGYSLTPAERAQLRAARPQSRPLVFIAPPVATDDPLPPGFTPAPVADFVPALVRDAEIEAEAAREAASEIAAIEQAAQAVDFDAFTVTDPAGDTVTDHAPVDYAPVFISAPVPPPTPAPIDPARQAKRERIASHFALVERLRAAGIVYAAA